MSKFANSRNLKLTAALTIGAEAGNAISVAVQLKDRDNGNNLAEATAIPFFLSDSATALDETAAAPDGGIDTPVTGGCIEWTADISGLLVTNASGAVTLVLTHVAGAATWYLVLVMPDGKLVVSSAITFA